MNTTATLSLQQYTLEIPTADTTLFKSLVKRFGWVVKKPKAKTHADSISPSADEWWNVPENVDMVNKGSEQLKDGQGVVLTTDELKARLGL